MSLRTLIEKLLFLPLPLRSRLLEAESRLSEGELGRLERLLRGLYEKERDLLFHLGQRDPLFLSELEKKLTFMSREALAKAKSARSKKDQTMLFGLEEALGTTP